MFRLTKISKWPLQLKNSSILREITRNASVFATNTVQTKDGRMTLSTGILGHLSESSVICNVGGSVVHAALNAARGSDPNEPFLPLTVDYRARQYAFGVIPGSRQRREAHGTNDEILVSRFIDRAVRPLFPKGYVNEVQITVTNHAADGIHDPTVAAVNAASLALMHSKQPWQGPIGCVRIGCIDGKLKIDPSLEEMKSSTLDFLYAGTENRTLMIETAADQVPESTMKEAMRLAHSAIQDIIEAQNKFIRQVSSTPAVLPQSVQSDLTTIVDTTVKREPFTIPLKLKSAVHAKIHEEALAMYAAGGATKEARGKSEGKLRADTLKYLADDPIWGKEPIVTRKMAVEAVMNNAFRTVLLRGGTRIDGRNLNQMRHISASAPVMPSVHGSSYFTRGDTHVMSSVTLGSKEDALEILPIAGSRTGEIEPNYFMLHYDFPPYCTGELGNAIALNRRMVGHGKLAERAVRPVLPSLESFPYTVRVYSECTSSNGSSSMASACGASLALMDAGVPLKAAVAGMSVGLITHENIKTLLPLLRHNPSLRAEDGSKPYVLLKDILGTEDHNGDMDFKIAGTAEGITAIQLDVKLEGGVPLFMLEEALDVAREGRLEILKTMNQTLSKSNAEMKPNAPKAVMIKYDEDRRGVLAGPGGEMIKYIQQEYQCTVDATEPGQAYIFGRDPKLFAQAESLVRDLVVQVKDGDVLMAQVLEIKDYGLTMKVNRAQEAILHMSDISYDEKLLKTPLERLFKVGQRFKVKVYSSEKDTGIIKVSRKLLKDPKAENDTIEVASSTEVIEPLPTFAVLPPKKYSQDYFKHSVASEEESKQSMERYAKILNPVVDQKGGPVPVGAGKRNLGLGGTDRRQQPKEYNNRNQHQSQHRQQQTREERVVQTVSRSQTQGTGKDTRKENLNQMNKFAVALNATAQPKPVPKAPIVAPSNGKQSSPKATGSSEVSTPIVPSTEPSVPEVSASVTKQHNIETKPSVEAKPSVESKPIVEVKPKVEVKTSVEAKPRVESKPSVEAKPKVEVKPSVEAKPKVEVKPSVEAKPKVEVKPSVETKPKVEVKPSVETQPSVEVKVETKTSVQSPSASMGASPEARTAAQSNDSKKSHSVPKVVNESEVVSVVADKKNDSVSNIANQAKNVKNSNDHVKPGNSNYRNITKENPNRNGMNPRIGSPPPYQNYPRPPVKDNLARPPIQVQEGGTSQPPKKTDEEYIQEIDKALASLALPSNPSTGSISTPTSANATATLFTTVPTVPTTNVSQSTKIPQAGAVETSTSEALKHSTAPVSNGGTDTSNQTAEKSGKKPKKKKAKKAPVPSSPTNGDQTTQSKTVEKLVVAPSVSLNETKPGIELSAVGEKSVPMKSSESKATNAPTAKIVDVVVEPKAVESKAIVNSSSDSESSVSESKTKRKKKAKKKANTTTVQTNESATVPVETVNAVLAQQVAAIASGSQ